MSEPTPTDPARHTAGLMVDLFERRFGPAHRQLARHASLPLLLTPELLQLLWRRFLRAEAVPWEAQADLLLSNLCSPAGGERFALSQAVRAVLLEELKAEEGGERRLQEIASLLLRCIRSPGSGAGHADRAYQDAQEWAALVYLPRHREQAVAGRRRELAALESRVRAGDAGAQAEAARLVDLVRAVEPEIRAYPELVELARRLGDLLEGGPERGADLDVNLALSPAEVRRGGTWHVAAPGRTPVPVILSGAGVQKLQKVIPRAGNPGLRGGAPGDLIVDVRLHRHLDAFDVAIERLSANARKQLPEELRTRPPQQFPLGLTTGQTWTNPVDRAEMVWVPPGEFTMGSGDNDPDAQDAGKPAHRVRLTRGFWLYRTPVTNAMYRQFVQETGFREPDFWHDERFNANAQPVVGVAWEDALAYCVWAGIRLPTEAEWEYGARGPESRRYPWGEEGPTPELAVFGRGGSTGRPAEVGSCPRGASWCGALDLAGNVWEWCADGWDENFYRKETTDDPLENSNKGPRVVRGGSWFSAPGHLRGADRLIDRADFRGSNLGFRGLGAVAQPSDTLEARSSFPSPTR